MTSFSTGHGVEGYGVRAQMKGASEIVLAQCDKVMDAEGKVVPMDDATRENIKKQITSYADNALRTIAIAYKDLQQGECGE